MGRERDKQSRRGEETGNAGALGMEEKEKRQGIVIIYL
jgi:hypothetical protein